MLFIFFEKISFLDKLKIILDFIFINLLLVAIQKAFLLYFISNFEDNLYISFFSSHYEILAKVLFKEFVL